jgi:hypothetical protein
MSPHNRGDSRSRGSGSGSGPTRGGPQMSPEPTNAESMSPPGSDAESELDQNTQLRAPRRSQWPPQAPQGMGSGYGAYPGGYPGGYTGYPPPPLWNTGPPPPGYPQPQPQQPIPPINQPVPVYFTSTVDWDAADKAQSGDDVHEQYAEAYRLMKELPFVFQKFSLRVGKMMNVLLRIHLHVALTQQLLQS